MRRVASPSANQLRELRRVLGLLATSLCLWLLAYQLPFSLTLHIGGDPELRRRFDDTPFLSGINGSEPPDRAACPDATAANPRQCWWWDLLGPGERPYRWTSSSSVVSIPGAGGGSFVVELLASGPPSAEPTGSQWQLGAGQPVDVAVLPGLPRRYRLLVQANAAGDLPITLRTQPFIAPRGDPRELGFVLYELRVTQAASGPRAPSWPQLALLAGSLGLIYGLGRGLGAGVGGAVALTSLFSLSAAATLAIARPALTLFSPVLAGLAVGCAAIGAIGWATTRAWSATDMAAARFARRLLGLTLLAFALRLGGMLHPHAEYSDSGLHANKLYAFTIGQVFQAAGLPDDAGGGQAPYPTGPYALILPGQLLVPPSLRVELVQTGTALLDSLALPLIATLLVAAGLGRRAALLAAACYLLPVSALESFAVGELANIGGQAMALPFVALLAGGFAVNRLRPGQTRLLLIGSLAIGLLAHSGVTLSLGALTAAAWGFTLLMQLRRRSGPIALGQFTLCAIGGLAVAVLLFYSAPVYLSGFVGRLASGSGGQAGVPALAILRESILGILGLVAPRSRAWPLPPLLCVAALAGLGMLWANRQPQAAGLRLALASWWVGALLTQALLLVADQGVRWSMFLYPALCLSAGPFLEAVWRRGRAGRSVAIVALTSIITYGLLVWVIQLRDYFHI